MTKNWTAFVLAISDFSRAQITTIPFQCLPRRHRHVFRHFCYNYVLLYVKFHRILAKKCSPTYYMRLATQAKCHQTIFKILLSRPVFLRRRSQRDKIIQWFSLSTSVQRLNCVKMYNRRNAGKMSWWWA